jgi:hypothetical protein
LEKPTPPCSHEPGGLTACYVEDPHLFARKLARITEKLRNEIPAQPPQVKLIPRLVAGESVCRRE